MSTPPAPSQSLYENLLRADAPDPKIRASAAVIPWRFGKTGALEVYWVRRAATMAFMGGWWAFPGGGVSRDDPSIAVAGAPATGEEATSRAAPDLDAAALADLPQDLAPGVVAGAIRELFEETGVLLEEGAPASAHPAMRRRLLRKEARFGELLEQGVDGRVLRLDASPLVFAGRWLTPPFAPLRFDNRFFLLEWPADWAVQPELTTGECAGPRGAELDRGEWIEPARALERWRTGEVLAAPPILHILTVLADDGPSAAGLARLRDPREADLGSLRRIEFRPGVILLPLRTPTLPPATHTNAFLLGSERGVLVDPATPFPDETDRLLEAVEAWRDTGQRDLVAVWLTHHHRDHVGAARAVRERFGVPICAHELAVEPLARLGIQIDQTLHDGQRVDLGSPTEPWPLRVLHTPGHTRDHLAFYAERHGTLIAGDLFSTLSTIVLDPPDGNLDAYLASIERVLALDPSTAFPAHGPGSIRPTQTFTAIRKHRLERDAAVRRCLDRGLESLADIVADVYPDLPAALRPVAERQVAAHVERHRPASARHVAGAP